MAKPDIEQLRQLYEPGLHLIPPHMREGVKMYLEHGIQTGHFMKALFSNDLMEAFARADDENSRAMRNWCQFMYCYMPSGSFGSPAKRAAWIAQFVDEHADG